MGIRRKGLTASAATHVIPVIPVIVTVVIAASWFAAVPTAGQMPPVAPRTADGKPNLNGIWQSFTTANWDILAQAAQPGPHPELMGAWGAEREGRASSRETKSRTSRGRRRSRRKTSKSGWS